MAQKHVSEEAPELLVYGQVLGVLAEDFSIFMKGGSYSLKKEQITARVKTNFTSDASLLGITLHEGFSIDTAVENALAKAEKEGEVLHVSTSNRYILSPKGMRTVTEMLAEYGNLAQKLVVGQN